MDSSNDHQTLAMECAIKVLEHLGRPAAMQMIRAGGVQALMCTLEHGTVAQAGKAKQLLVLLRESVAPFAAREEAVC